MTTWIFNVVRELLADDALETIWIDPNDNPAEIQFASAPGNILAKCHHFSQRLTDSADLVVYSYRDLRTAAVSYMRKFEVSGTQNLLDTWVQSGRLWLPRADIVLRYETTEREKLKAIGKLRAALRSKHVDSGLCRFDDEEILQRVDAEFQARQTPDEISHDSNTMILPAHRTFQPRPEDLNETERSLYAHVEHEFANWLTDHGYLHADDYGQELEYHIGRHLMRCLNAKVVVDVGVERGSFTDLACAAGVARVIGFEPLPRHFDYLTEKYADTAQVEIHPAAVSEHSGTGRLHVATDVDGQELDFHHTLSDLGDSATIIRSGKSIDVAIVSLAELADAGRIPRDIDFLKIDTDGHDLAVLRGLGDVHPRVIMAEYWDTLPETSGISQYSLGDLANWAHRHDYRRMLVVRRNGRIELVQMDAPWSLPGDWGNVFFIHRDADFERARDELDSIARMAHANLCEQVSGLGREYAAKEAEIRALSAALTQNRQRELLLMRESEAKEAEIHTLATALAELRQRERHC